MPWREINALADGRQSSVITGLADILIFPALQFASTPMTFLIAYVTIFIVFGVIDAIWLWQVASTVYKPMLGEMMVDNVRILPAVVFYLFFPVGIVVFAVLPALRDGTALTAFGAGALLGALCYATYDLTNYATLKNWTLQATIMDIVYGAFVAGVCAAAAFWAVQVFQPR